MFPLKFDFKGHLEILVSTVVVNVSTLLNNVSLRLLIICSFIFFPLLPKSTAMVMAGRSVHLTTLFPGQA